MTCIESIRCVDALNASLRTINDGDDICGTIQFTEIVLRFG